MPPAISDLADEERGLILLTGTTGSGKSTTLAAIIDQINETKSKHIVTIEDPIEYLHTDRKSIVNQREVGMDTVSFKRAMRRVLRQDPDVILIGEMRDEETVRSALSAAETGHLVLSTVHTIDAPETVNRIIDFFPLHEQNQARAMLASTLKGVVSQRLVPTPDGDGRVAVCEILRMTGRARDMVMDQDQTARLHEVIQEGEYYGMQTFDQALLKHYQAGPRVDGGCAARRLEPARLQAPRRQRRSHDRPRWRTSWTSHGSAAAPPARSRCSGRCPRRAGAGTATAPRRRPARPPAATRAPGAAVPRAAQICCAGHSFSS